MANDKTTVTPTPSMPPTPTPTDKALDVASAIGSAALGAWGLQGPLLKVAARLGEPVVSGMLGVTDPKKDPLHRDNIIATIQGTLAQVSTVDVVQSTTVPPQAQTTAPALKPKDLKEALTVVLTDYLDPKKALLDPNDPTKFLHTSDPQQGVRSLASRNMVGAGMAMQILNLAEAKGESAQNLIRPLIDDESKDKLKKDIDALATKAAAEPNKTKALTLLVNDLTAGIGGTADSRKILSGALSEDIEQRVSKIFNWSDAAQAQAVTTAAASPVTTAGATPQSTTPAAPANQNVSTPASPAAVPTTPAPTVDPKKDDKDDKELTSWMDMFKGTPGKLLFGAIAAIIGLLFTGGGDIGSLLLVGLGAVAAAFIVPGIIDSFTAPPTLDDLDKRGGPQDGKFKAKLLDKNNSGIIEDTEINAVKESDRATLRAALDKAVSDNAGVTKVDTGYKITDVKADLQFKLAPVSTPTTAAAVPAAAKAPGQ